MPKLVISVLYSLAMFGLSMYALQSLIMAALFIFQRRRPRDRPPEPPENWPTVTVQLPLFNERFVVERLVDAACALDYPAQALSIQILDDSSDDTTALARRKTDFYRKRGVQIELIHRDDRQGYKAGALARGLKTAAGEMIAIFDADFVPPPDFLRRLVPYLSADPVLGMVQARWGHMNADYNWLTRGQALFLDGHFMIEQSIRHRSDLLFNFNGSAGIWRRACIEEAGGWQEDTLSEDLDLSYRAQMKGWRFAYIPEVVAPAEIPPQVMALKQQQYRCAYGSIQVFRKLGKQIWHARLSLIQRVAATLHLSTYLAHPMMLVLLLASLPVVHWHGAGLLLLGWLSLAGFGPPLLFALSQWAAYPDWKRHFAYFPVLMCIGAGIAFNNSCALVAALGRRPARFARTPKHRLERNGDVWSENSYRLPIDWSVWVELGLAGYALLAALLAIKEYPPLVPMLALFTFGFGYFSLLGLAQERRPVKPAFQKEELNDADSI